MAKIKEVTVSLGMSFSTKIEQKETWVKPQVGFRIEMEDDQDAKDPEVRKQVIARAFEVAEEELSEELKRLLSDDKS